jgi:hypothetical protein
VRNAVGLLVRTPHYVSGRFRTIRALYARAEWARQRFSSAQLTLRIGDRYARETLPLTIRSSALATTTFDTKGHVRNLSRNAYSGGLKLTAHACASLVQAAKEQPLRTLEGPQLVFSELVNSAELRERVAIAVVSNSSLIPTVQSIAADPLIVDVVESYLGYFPKRVSSWLYWSPRNAMSDEQRESLYQTVRFHYDVHGFNFLYVNFYLFDTDENSGAHVLIEGSHRDKRPRHLFGSAKLTEQQAAADYGEERIKVIRGGAGDGFFEDASCYHKALPPRERDRLMFQLRYQ